MKIIQVIARVNQGGTARWLEVLVSELRNLNHEVQLLSGNVEGNEIEDPSFLRLDGIRIKGLGRSLSLKQDVITIFELRKYFKKEQPDVINTHTAKAGVIGRLASLGLPVKVIHTYHGHLLYGYFTPAKTRLVVVIEKILARFTDRIIAVGDQVRKDLLDAGIGKESQYRVIHPGIPKILFIERSGARSKFKIGERAFAVGWLGRLTNIKKPQRVLEIAKLMPELTFLIGGTGELLQELELGSPENVRMLGWVDPKEFWPACDVALLTSDNEGLPTSLIEAAFAGKPIVSEDVGSAREIFEDDVGGYLVNDLKSRVDALNNLEKNPQRLSSMGSCAKKYAEANFSVMTFIETHLEVYGLN